MTGPVTARLNHTVARLAFLTVHAGPPSSGADEIGQHLVALFDICDDVAEMEEAGRPKTPREMEPREMTLLGRAAFAAGSAVVLMPFLIGVTDMIGRLVRLSGG